MSPLWLVLNVQQELPSTYRSKIHSKIHQQIRPDLLQNFRVNITVGTKIIADPEKCFQELISEKLLIFTLRDGPCLELVIVSSNFQALPPLAGQITGIGLKAINSSKKVLKITGPALFRINSVIISARTVQK